MSPIASQTLTGSPAASQQTGLRAPVIRTNRPISVNAAGLHDLMMPDDVCDIGMLQIGPVEFSAELSANRNRVRVIRLAGNGQVDAAGDGDRLDGLIIYDARRPELSIRPDRLAKLARRLVDRDGHIIVSWRNPYATSALRQMAKGRPGALFASYYWLPNRVARSFRAAGFEDIALHFLAPHIDRPTKAISLHGQIASLYYERLRLAERHRSLPFRLATRIGALAHLRPYLEPAFMLTAKS